MRREFMTYRRLSTLFALLCALAVTPAWGVSKEMIQLQTQVQQLQEQMTAMQRGFDERMGVMKNLVEQDTDAVNKVAAALTSLQTTLQKQQTDGGSKTDQLSGQIQALNDTMDEIKVRLAKVTKQLEDMQAAQQSLGAQQAAQQAQQQQIKDAPPPDVLYSNSRTTSSFIPTPIWRGTATSTWARFSSSRQTISLPYRVTIRSCRTFP